MKPILIPFVIIVVGAWLSTAIHGFASLGHLSGRLSLQQMLFRGIEWFNPDNFTDRGQWFRRRMALSMLAFFGGLLLLATVAVIVG